MLRTYEQHARLKLAATIASVIIIGGTVITADKLKSKDTASAVSLTPSSTPIDTATPVPTSTPAVASTPVATSTPISTPAATPNSSGYTNGTYSSTINYQVPHGEESIGVTLALSNGVITTVSIQNSESDRDSQSYQEEFASLYKGHVVGKSIKGFELGTISGASDTTAAFNDAVARIASKAQA